MTRNLGALFLAGGAVLLGICAAYRTKKRVSDLRLLILGLRAVLRELSYRLAPLPELLRGAEAQTTGRVQHFFSLCALGAEHLNGRSFRTVWAQAAAESRMCLIQEDWQCLEQLGPVLGRYDGENQRLALEAVLDGLDAQCAEATRQSRSQGKLYSVLGVTAGAFLLILLW